MNPPGYYNGVFLPPFGEVVTALKLRTLGIPNSPAPPANAPRAGRRRREPLTRRIISNSFGTSPGSNQQPGTQPGYQPPPYQQTEYQDPSKPQPGYGNGYQPQSEYQAGYPPGQSTAANLDQQEKTTNPRQARIALDPVPHWLVEEGTISEEALERLNEDLETVNEVARDLHKQLEKIFAAAGAGQVAETAVKVGAHFVPGGAAVTVALGVASGTTAGVAKSVTEKQTAKIFTDAGLEAADLLKQINERSLADAVEEGRPYWLRVALCDQPVLLNARQSEGALGAIDPKRKERLRDVAIGATDGFKGKAANRFPVLPFMDASANQEVLLIEPHLSDVSETGNPEAPKVFDPDFLAKRRAEKGRRSSSREPGVGRQLIGAALGVVAYPIRAMQHKKEIKKHEEMGEKGFPAEGDFVLRHFIVVTRELTAEADTLPKNVLCILPAIRTDWDPARHSLEELFNPAGYTPIVLTTRESRGGVPHLH